MAQRVGRQESASWRAHVRNDGTGGACKSTHNIYSNIKYTNQFQLLLLRSLAVWSLSSSEAVQAKIKESYKQARHDDDLNQPLSVQPWGRDGLKRKYWLIEGLDDTHFRLYRESNPTVKKIKWWSIAGNIPELKAVADKLDGEKSIFSKKLSEKIKNAIPRFEGSEEVSYCYDGWVILLTRC